MSSEQYDDVKDENDEAFVCVLEGVVVAVVVFVAGRMDTYSTVSKEKEACV